MATGRHAFTNEELPGLLDGAIGGATRPLYAELCRLSGLPGTRVNEGLVLAFADACARRAARADRLVVAMATLDADEAPGDTALEILPVCGIVALSARMEDAPRLDARSMRILHDACDDLRFRVRDAAIVALSRLGAAKGEEVLREVGAWMDGYFHAACVLAAATTPDFLARIDDASLAVERLHQGFALAHDAPRAASRYPGHKALLEALSRAPAPLALRLGAPVLDELSLWSRKKDPVIRETVLRAVRAPRLRGRFAADVARIEAEVAAAGPAPRDPGKEIRPTRKRGRARR